MLIKFAQAGLEEGAYRAVNTGDKIEALAGESSKNHSAVLFTSLADSQSSGFETVEQTCDIGVVVDHALTNLGAGGAGWFGSAQDTQYVVLSRRKVVIAEECGGGLPQHFRGTNDIQGGFFFKKSERLRLLNLRRQFSRHKLILFVVTTIVKRNLCACTAGVVESKEVQRIHLISTGGTIEKIYSESTGSVVNLETKIDRYLKQLRLPDAAIDTISVMNIDSLEMTQKDREKVLEVVRRQLTGNIVAPIVITHGTDTLVETGLFLKERLPNLSVPIIFTGAMTPLGFERSDGLQNLTESLLAARLLPPGIWLVIHNQVFPIDQVRKDRDLSRFVPVLIQS